MLLLAERVEYSLVYLLACCTEEESRELQENAMKILIYLRGDLERDRERDLLLLELRLSRLNRYG